MDNCDLCGKLRDNINIVGVKVFGISFNVCNNCSLKYAGGNIVRKGIIYDKTICVEVRKKMESIIVDIFKKDI